MRATTCPAFTGCPCRTVTASNSPATLTFTSAVLSAINVPENGTVRRNSAGASVKRSPGKNSKTD